MLKGLAIAVALTAASISIAAAADTVTVFQAQGTLEDGAVLGGTMTIDVTSGILELADLTLTSPDAGTYSTIQLQGYSSTQGEYLTFVGESSDQTTNSLHLGLLTTSLVGYLGGSFASADDMSNPSSNTHYYSDLRDASGNPVGLTQGTLTPVPIPAAGWLLLTALGALTCVARVRSPRQASA